VFSVLELELLSQLAMRQLFVDFSISQENMTNAANERGATMGGNQTNQTGRGPLEQVGEELGGVFGGGENQSLYLESSSALLFQYTVKSTRPYCLQYQNYKKEIIIANFSL
jgi:hypothetical protein